MSIDAKPVAGKPLPDQKIMQMYERMIIEYLIATRPDPLAPLKITRADYNNKTAIYLDWELKFEVHNHEDDDTSYILITLGKDTDS